MTAFSRHPDDPIIAIATAPGRGAVGIVRVSGRGLQPLIEALCGRQLQPRYATYLPFKDAKGEAIDHGLALYFPAPHSYTGEEVLEFQAHGGPVVLQLLLARCLDAAAALDPASQQPALANLRLAEPGEFTERAYLNDKLDLAQAEAVMDLIDASTEAAARSATRSLTGAFSTQIDSLREKLVRLRMLVEATLDFPEEEIDFLQKADASGQLRTITESVDAVLDRARQGALLREGIKVVLAGQPNVGKSSLLNALAGAELAIVTPVAGTTRDKVTETIQIQGVPLHVIDTAGLRHSSDEVEQIGIARSWTEIEGADAVLFLHDVTRAGDADYRQAESEIRSRLPTSVRLIEVYNKADAIDSEAVLQVTAKPTPRGIVLSAKTGQGLESLRQALLEAAGWHAQPEGVFIARARHVQALLKTREHLALAHQHASTSNPALDLYAEELRLAHADLGLITGEFSADDLLGEIFGRFCIGK
ncbi:tRNA uridine-5-carboxymethylaminomethyl(34) synthesis GTPase MnmE [soil metagenome]